MTPQGVVTRVIASVVALTVMGWLNFGHALVSPLVAGRMAANQLSNTDMGYVDGVIASRFFNGSGLSVGFMLLVVLLIWAGPIYRGLRSA